MRRYPIKEMKGMSAIDFAISALRDRKESVTNPYAPLNQKICKTIHESDDLKKNIDK